MRPEQIAETEIAYRDVIHEWFNSIPESYRMPFSIFALALIFFFIIRYDFMYHYVFGKNIRPKTKIINVFGFKISSATIQALVFMLFMVISTLISLYYYQKSKL